MIRFATTYLALTAILLATPVQAGCRLHTYWHYPWPQRCPTVSRNMVAMVVTPAARIMPQRKITVDPPRGPTTDELAKLRAAMLRDGWH